MRPHPPIPPKCRPIQPKQDIFSDFRPMGLHFGGHTPFDSRPRRRQSGGNCTTRGSDTPATRRKKASCSANPPSQPDRSAPRHLQDRRRAGWREKTRPTPPLRRLFCEKVLPARVKTPNLGQFERTGRTFSRFHDLTATQGELFRARRRRPSSALPISDPAPLVRRAPEDPESPAAVPMSSARALP